MWVRYFGVGAAVIVREISTGSQLINDLSKVLSRARGGVRGAGGGSPFFGGNKFRSIIKTMYYFKSVCCLKGQYRFRE